MEPTILLETQEYLIINKPAGLMVHADGKSTEPTLVDWVLEKYPAMAGVGEPMTYDGVSFDRPGIVHRLDKETSGVMVLAKNQETFLWLKQGFKERTIHKQYHAFVWGSFKESAGRIDQPIGRSSGDFRRWQAGRGVRGEMRDAVTAWQVMDSFEDEHRDIFSFLELSPKTGRTHQLRVHMKFLQRPIVSDSLYAPTKRQALGFSRVALHAKKLSFTDREGVEVVVEAPYPADFEAALARYVKI